MLPPRLQRKGVNLLSLPISLNISHKLDCLLVFIAIAVALPQKMHLAPIPLQFSKAKFKPPSANVMVTGFKPYDEGNKLLLATA